MSKSVIKKIPSIDNVSTNTKPVRDKSDMLDWHIKFTETVVAQVRELIAEQEEAYGAEFGMIANLNIIAGLISATMMKTLLSVPKGNNLTVSTSEHYAAYRQMKEHVEDAVSAAFEGVAKNWSGKAHEYACSVQIVLNLLANR